MHRFRLLSLLVAVLVVVGESTASDLSGLQSQTAWIDGLIAKGPNITADQLKLVAQLKASLLNNTLRELFAAHARDQELLNSHANALGDCDKELAIKLQTFNPAREVLKQMQSHKEQCFAQEGRLREQLVLLESRLSALLSNATPPVAPASWTGLGETLERRLAQQVYWYQRFDKQYRTSKENVTSARQLQQEKKMLCTQTQAVVEIGFCQLMNESSVLTSGYNSCRNRLQSLFNISTTRVQENRRERIAEYKSISRLTCYLDALLANDSATEKQLSVCNGTTDNVTMMDIVVPAVTPYLQKVIQGLQMVPPPGITCKAWLPL